MRFFTTTVFQLVAVWIALVAPAKACYCVNNAGTDNVSTEQCCKLARGKWNYPVRYTFSKTKSQKSKFQQCCTLHGDTSVCSCSKAGGKARSSCFWEDPAPKNETNKFGDCCLKDGGVVIGG
ncbi:hypothetical protein V8F33_003523 [Rhypophila sp. PSN 637]